MTRTGSDAPAALRRIVVGCDGSPQCADAVALGIALAEATGATLLLAHVYPAEPTWYGSQRSVARARRERVHHVLDPALRAVPDSVPAETLAVGSESPARGLHDLAAAERADLLVLGSTHRGPVGRVLPGSVAEVLLTGAPCAVAVAPRGFAGRGRAPIRVVAAGFDGSRESETALERAHGLAGALGARLRAIAVAERHRLPHPRADRHPVADRLAGALERLGGSPSEDGEVVEGDAVEALSATAGDVDLMVVGSRGYGPLRHVVLGSVSSPLLRGCGCPLIVLPRSAPPGAAEETHVAATRRSG